jgi:hypothetical protein
MRINIIVFNLCFILSTALVAQNSLYYRDGCFPSLTSNGGYGRYGGIPNMDTCGVNIWNKTLFYKGHCERYIYLPLDTLNAVKTRYTKQNKGVSTNTSKKYYFITDTINYNGKLCMKIYETYYEPKATYIQLIQNGYVPKVCEKMPNITDVIISDVNIHPSIHRIKNIKRIIIGWSYAKGLKYLKSETLEEFISSLGNLTEQDIIYVLNQNSNLKKLVFGLNHDVSNQEAILKKALMLKKLEYLYLFQYKVDSLPSNVFSEMSAIKGLRITYANPTIELIFSPYKSKLKKEDFRNIKQMKQLIIEGYRFTNILEVLPELTNLEVLEINLDEYKDNTEIVRVLQQMPKLKCVHLFSDSTRQKDLEALLPFKNCDCKD